MFLASMAMVSVPATSPPGVTFRVEPEITTGVPADEMVTVDVYIDADPDTAVVAWGITMKVNPDVLKPGYLVMPGVEILAVSGEEGYYLYDWCIAHPWDPDPGKSPTLFLTGSKDEAAGVINGTTESIKLWTLLGTGVGANGTGKLATFYFTSKNETAYSPIEIVEAVYFTSWQSPDLDKHVPDTIINGHYAPVVLTIRPNAPGTFTGWTAYPAAPNWQCVDEVDPNNDTDYVYVTATGLADSYNLQNTTQTGNILNVSINIYAKQTTGNEKVKLMLVINGTKYYGSEYVPGTEYALYTSHWANNPATNLSWTWSDINALEAGQESLEVVTPGQDIYPIDNMNFTSDATGWVYGEANDVNNFASGAWSSTGGNDDPGCYDLMVDDTASNQAFDVEQWVNYTFTVDTIPSQAMIYASYRYTSDDDATGTPKIKLVRPDGGVVDVWIGSTVTLAKDSDTGHTYVSVDATSNFTLTGTYQLSLYTHTDSLKAKDKATVHNYWDDAGLKITTAPVGWQGEMSVTQLYVEIVYAPVVGFDLNLRVMDWDLIDNIPGAYVYVNSDVKISDANGWANWTGVSGTVQIKVKWYGFWVNGTSVTMDSDKTIDVQCNIFDIEVTCIEGLQSAFLQSVNVTVYNATSVAGNMIRTGTTGSDGKVSLANVPNATLTFTCYDGASPKHVIANDTRTIIAENQTETITCIHNYISTTHTWGIIGSYSSALCLGLILLLGFAAGKPSRMFNCLKERIKKVRSKQNKRKEGERKHESFNA